LPDTELKVTITITLQMRNKVSNTRDKVEIVKYKITLYRKSHCVGLGKIKF